MRTLAALLLCLLCVSCSQLDYSAVAANNSTEHIKLTTFGGSQSLDSAGGTRYTSNHNKTAGQFFQTVAAGFAAWANTASAAAGEVTSRVKDTNAAGVAKNASNNAAAVQINGQNTALETAKIPKQ